MPPRFLICIGLAVATQAFAQATKFTPPPAEKIGALLNFPGPVTLSLRVVPQEELNRRPKRGVRLAAYSYSDPAHTSQTISIAIYPKGEFLKDRRAELSRSPTTLASRAPDGRSILQFPLGFGPGGEADGVLIACRDPRFEIVLIQQTDYHDDEDPKLFAHHAKPRRKIGEIVTTIEALIIP